MWYEFKCKKCGKVTNTNSSCEELPETVSCLSCYEIHNVKDSMYILTVEDTNKKDEKLRVTVQQIERHDKVCRECAVCKKSIWINKSENKPYTKYACANCNLS